ncbi:MAG: aminoacyl-tRNA hydrolase [Candidatus Saganbacteria bacterium]|nr:aminoacyl-tRNA hydrolase [Candidatus Saganbacteria bacterium]
MYLIVGLGNPGSEYKNSRHNLGFRVVDELCQRLHISSLKSKCSSFMAESRIDERKVILAQPQTFMNNSGPAVKGLLEWFKILPSHLILIYDDVDLEVGQIRLREKGGAGGHHGVESVISSIGTTEFARVRIGIGRENLTDDVTDYVLQNIPPAEKEKLDEAMIEAANAVETIVKNGLSVAMNRFNRVDE